MRKISVLSRTLVPAVAVALLAGACAQPTPEERVAELRVNYEATLQNFVVREEPLIGDVPEGEMPEGEEAMAEEAPAAGADEGEEIIEEVPVRQDVVLDILVRHSNHDNLPGLTVEVAQLGEGAADEMSWEEIEASPERKATWRVYLDTSEIGRGQGNSVVHTLEDADGVEPGDKFVVTVRKPVPAGERGDYREFAEAS